MNPQRILILQGHPDASVRHLGHALADAYAAGAEAAGHAVRRLEIATLDFPLLRGRRDWEEGSVPPGLAPAQDDIAWSTHIVLLYPLWLGEMPALVKGFLEQVARPGFAFEPSADGNAFARKGLTGRSARVIVTMGMPATVYRWYFRAHSLKSLERNILGFVGISPVRATLIGSVEGLGEAGCARWLARMGKLGAQAQ